MGTRYGDSLIRVLSASRLTRIVIADIWHESYFGANNNGTGFDRSHAHVERMLKAYGYAPGDVMFLDGDSAKTVPYLDKRDPFDLVLIDGDHDYIPAQTDLMNCWPLVAPGGLLVFDDVGGDQKLMEMVTSFRAQMGRDVAALYTRMNKKFGVAVLEKESTAGETSKVREMVLPYFKGENGIDIGSSRDPLTRRCVAFDRSDYNEVTCRGDARALPFKDSTFDWVWSSHCLEDFEDTNAVLEEWLRVLQPGGTIGLYVPHPDFYTPNNTDHKHPGFRIEELMGMLLAHGCQILATKVDKESTPGVPRYSSLVIATKL